MGFGGVWRWMEWFFGCFAEFLLVCVQPVLDHLRALRDIAPADEDSEAFYILNEFYDRRLLN